MTAAVGPLMFLTVIWGVISIGNPARLGTIGKKVCVRCLSQNVVAASLGGILLLSFFHTEQTAAVFNGEQTATLLQILIGIIGLLPFFVYLSIVRMGMSGNFTEYLYFVRMILIYLLGSTIYITYQLIYVRLRTKILIRKVIKHVLPSYLIALATSSSAAAFAECNDNLKNKFHVKKRLIDFGLPLGLVMYMPDFAMWMVLSGGACLEYCNMQITPDRVLMLVIVSALLAVAAPPIPGSIMTCYAMLFAQMGIPAEMLAIASVINLIGDAFGTAGNVFANQMQLLIMASELEMLEPEAKRSIPV